MPMPRSRSSFVETVSSPQQKGQVNCFGSRSFGLLVVGLRCDERRFPILQIDAVVNDFIS